MHLLTMLGYSFPAILGHTSYIKELFSSGVISSNPEKQQEIISKKRHTVRKREGGKPKTSLYPQYSLILLLGKPSYIRVDHILLVVLWTFHFSLWGSQHQLATALAVFPFLLTHSLFCSLILIYSLWMIKPLQCTDHSHLQ